ncbi:MAG: hypothetical protein NC110_03520 [Ruminococcus sp.]|nr:hypothetical protein [Ruminococcus sp.]
MRFKKKKVKEMPEDKYRIIKIGKEALFEHIYEGIIDKEEQLFDVTDSTTIVKCFDINWETGEFIAIARKELEENEHLQFDIDTQKLIAKMKDTTDTLFTDDVFIELSKDEVDEMLKE